MPLVQEINCFLLFLTIPLYSTLFHTVYPAHISRTWFQKIKRLPMKWSHRKLSCSDMWQYYTLPLPSPLVYVLHTLRKYSSLHCISSSQSTFCELIASESAPSQPSELIAKCLRFLLQAIQSPVSWFLLQAIQSPVSWFLLQAIHSPVSWFLLRVHPLHLCSLSPSHVLITQNTKCLRHMTELPLPSEVNTTSHIIHSLVSWLFLRVYPLHLCPLSFSCTDHRKH